MKEKTIISRQHLKGERALFTVQDMEIRDCIFSDGESPLKESRDITLVNCDFRWRYPLWYCERVHVTGGEWNEDVRAGVWYTNDIVIEDCLLACPKGIRRCRGVTLRRVNIPAAQETIWDCRDVVLEDVTAVGAYFAMNCNGMVIRNLTLDGPYSFDGAKNVEIRNSRLISKDAFWNSENVTVYDSYIKGEYLGWNAKNLTLVNCVVESLQGFCYIDNLVMKNCRTENTTLAFEYSTVDLDIRGTVDSIINPTAGIIRVGGIGELTMDPSHIDPARTTILYTNAE